MGSKIKILGLTLGDPFSLQSRSGVNYNIFTRFKSSDICELVDVYDLDLKGLDKIYSAAKNISLDRKVWGQKLHQNPCAFNTRSRNVTNILNNIDKEYDIIFQDGAMFMPPRNMGIKYVSYHDCNVILSSQGGDYAHDRHLRGKDLQKTISQERMVYEGAELIFTMSNWLKDSLIHDFNITESKIKTVYAGTNLKVKQHEKHYDGKTILFIGKNFVRKGGGNLLEAFRHVKKKIPKSRLIIVGPNIDIKEDGVVVYGLISSKTELEKLFKQASVFVMPSLFEPFGIVFAEAFAFKTPCIGTNICAMPEIIENEKGGFLVPPDNPKILSDRIVTILEDESLSRDMGEFGFAKVTNIFNWDVVSREMMNSIASVV